MGSALPRVDLVPQPKAAQFLVSAGIALNTIHLRNTKSRGPARSRQPADDSRRNGRRLMFSAAEIPIQ